MASNYPEFISLLQKTDPLLYEKVSGIFDIAMAPGELDAKTKILITLALDAIKGSSQGVKVLSGSARKMGITDNQIAEALRLAYFVSGNNVLATMKADFEA